MGDPLAAVDRPDPEAPGAVADGVYYLMMLITGALAAEHLGLQTSLVNGLILLTAGSALASVSVGFAFGSRDTFRDIIAKHYAERLFPPGTCVAVASVQGVVQRYGPRTVVVKTADSELYLGCARMLEEVRVTAPLPVDRPSA